VSDHEQQTTAIAVLAACLDTLEVTVDVPDGSSPGEQVAFLVGALGAVGDALAAHGDLYEENDEFTPHAAEGYLAATVGRGRERVREAMSYRLLNYCAVIQPVGLDTAPDAATAAAHQLMKAAAEILNSSIATPEQRGGLLAQALAHLQDAGEHLVDAVVDAGGAGNALPDDFTSKCLDIIERAGHYTQFVGGDPASGAPPFAYTVGLSSQESHGYELAVSGLGRAAADAVLRQLMAVLGRDELIPAEGLEVAGALAEGYAVRLRSASTEGPFGMIDQLLGERSTVWQAVWPDQDRRFPGEPGCTLSPGAQHLL
jgi:hypothetical protein